MAFLFARIPFPLFFLGTILFYNFFPELNAANVSHLIIPLSSQNNSMNSFVNLLDLFNNIKHAIMIAWEGTQRHRMPKRFFLSGCTG
jgi:hypothetical protein